MSDDKLARKLAIMTFRILYSTPQPSPAQSTAMCDRFCFFHSIFLKLNTRYLSITIHQYTTHDQLISENNAMPHYYSSHEKHNKTKNQRCLMPVIDVIHVTIIELLQIKSSLKKYAKLREGIKNKKNLLVENFH